MIKQPTIIVPEPESSTSETNVIVDELEKRRQKDGFLLIAAGEFMMGGNKYPDERPVHQVRISQAFEIGKYQVTQALWEAVMHGNPSRFKGANLPVETVSWDDAQEFITRLNAGNDDYDYRLPTEAEWEYACRAGTIGDYAGNLDEMGWYDENSGGRTHPVGEKKANDWGVYDMHGNVSEWCLDWYNKSYYANSPDVDPQGPASGTGRVFRGGGWDIKAKYSRSALRAIATPDFRFFRIGLRLVRTLR
jgi:formylglycine-generating enzyme required for sulfatase activity